MTSQAIHTTYEIGLWIIVFENIISDEEAPRMIKLGSINGYQGSSNVGSERIDGTHENKIGSDRTSTNAVSCVDRKLKP